MDCFQIPPVSKYGSAVIEALSLVCPGQKPFQLVCFGLILMHPSPTAQTPAKSCSFVPPSQTGKRTHWHANCCTIHLSYPLTKHTFSFFFTATFQCITQILCSIFSPTECLKEVETFYYNFEIYPTYII